MDQVPVKDTPVPDHQQTRETGIPQSYPQDKAPATAAEHGVSEVAQQRPDIAGDSEKDHNKGAPEGGYPEQLHAGKVGYGPHYAEMHGRVVSLTFWKAAESGIDVALFNRRCKTKFMVCSKKLRAK